MTKKRKYITCHEGEYGTGWEFAHKLDDNTDLEVFENIISLVVHQDITARNELKRKAKKKANDFYAACSNKMGYPINEININRVPEKEQLKILDNLYSDALIKPSHQFNKYSLIRKNLRKDNFDAQISAQDLVEKPSELAKLHHEASSRMYEIIREYESHNTQRAHEGDIIYWQAWLSAIGFDFEKPISDNEVKAFIIQHAEGLDNKVDKKLVDHGYKNALGPHSLATIKRRIASLNVYLELYKHQLLGKIAANPCKNEEIRFLLRKLTRKFGSSKPAGKAITKDILSDMVNTCHNNKLIDKRDKALLLFAWCSGGRRRSEVVTADIKDLVRDKGGDFIYTIPKSKTDQEGRGFAVPIKGSAAEALNDWIDTAKITEGSIFRSISKGSEVRKSLSPNDVHRIVRRRLKRAGFDEKQFGAHSLRSGFVTEAGRQGKSIGDVMQMTTHRSVGTVMRYYQAGAAKNNSAANLVDEK